MKESDREKLIQGLYKSAFGESDTKEMSRRSEFDSGTGTLYIKEENIDLKTAQEAIDQIERHIMRIKEIAKPENKRKIRLYRVAQICIKKQFGILEETGTIIG